jgi:transposase InsO family protein
MTKDPTDQRKKIALKRYDLIAPLVKPGLPRGAQTHLIKEICAQPHLDENGNGVFVTPRTVERHLAAYRRDGLQGLEPAVRPEKDSLKAFPHDALDEAVKLRLAHPEMSADSIIDALNSRNVPGAVFMRVSTLNRHLRRLGKDRPALKRKVPKRYVLLSVDGAHQLWIGDVWDGPCLYDPQQQKNRRLRLVAILDSHTRYIVYAAFYWNENRPCFEDALLKAMLQHGVMEILYLDNAKVFRSPHLKRIAAELGFRVTHTKARQPQGRGKLERWFRTVAEKCQPLLKAAIGSGEISTLEDANLFLTAWIETRYHQRRHGTLKMSPAAALKAAFENWDILAQYIEPESIREAFLWRESRQVSPLAAIKIYSNLYEVDERLIGKQVEVRFNPYDLTRMLVYYEGDFCCEARPYRMKNFTDKRVEDRQADAAQMLDETMHHIVAEHQGQITKRAGISFVRATEVRHD